MRIINLLWFTKIFGHDINENVIDVTAKNYKNILFGALMCE